MAWEELNFDKPHLAYMIIGGFTSLFMLCSLFIKERLYIGEATVATLVGVIFGPHAAGLFDPLSWGNTDKITLELSRIVLVVQCFAVGVELPKAYMERHWRSVISLLLPVMTVGWLVTSLIIWVCVAPLSWLQSLAVAACVTATDPVLASSVVGKGKFAKRVPKHLRDVLSAESGCNDGMAFPFIYLAYYLIHYNLEASEVTFHWIVIIILYECVFGAVYGFAIGYIGRHAIKYAERHSLIDRDSFLVFYFVLALFCSGSASGLGLDDLLVGFAAGVGFSNDGWFVEKTEESHVSNVIDLLLNLSYFVYLGAIIPWQDYNNADIGLSPWRLVVIAIFVLLFRRIPAMLAFKAMIPDIKNWREALFAGHFGPIGVGAIFAVVLLRAELENGSTQPDDPNELEMLAGNENYYLIQVIWPIVTFLVITSILVHGSSIAVFTLGKRINTLTLTMSYTQDNDSTWMDRLPRIASRGRSMSRNSKLSEESSDEKADFQPGTLGPVGVPRNFLRRQKEEEYGSAPGSRATSKAPKRRKKKYEGGPVHESAFGHQPFWEDKQGEDEEQDGDEGEPPDMVEADAKHEQKRKEARKRESESPTESESPDIEAYQEGHQMIVEDEEGNVLESRDIADESPDMVRQDLLADIKKLRSESSGEHAKGRHHAHDKPTEGEEIEHHVAHDLEHPKTAWKNWLHKKQDHQKPAEEGKSKSKAQPHRGPAQAYQYGNSIVVEDADGEVVKTYDIPRQSKQPKQHSKQAASQGVDEKDAPSDRPERPALRRGLTRMGTWTGLSRISSRTDAGAAALQALAGDGGEGPSQAEKVDETKSKAPEDDPNIRFRVHGIQRRMNKGDFIKQIQALDPKARVEVVDQVSAPEDMKDDVRSHAHGELKLNSHANGSKSASKSPVKPQAKSKSPVKSKSPPTSRSPAKDPRSGDVEPALHQAKDSNDTSDDDLYLVDSHGRKIPVHDVRGTVARASEGKPETAAQRRRRLAAQQAENGSREEDSDDDGTERVPPVVRSSSRSHVPRRPSAELENDDETPAERRRRLGALGKAENAESDSDEDGGPRRRRNTKPAPQETSSSFSSQGQGPSAAATATATGGESSASSRPMRERRGPPQSPIVEEEEENSAALDIGQSQDQGQQAEDTPPDSPRGPGIRFADMPRGEGRGRTRRFGRTMGMRRA